MSKIFFRSSLLAVSCLAVWTLTAGPTPWDSWRSGYSNYEKAETLREKHSYVEALTAYQKAKEHYLDVRSARPDWNQRVIAARLSDCDKKIKEMQRLLGETGTTAAAKTAETKTADTPSASPEKNVPAAPREIEPVSVVVVDKKELAKLRGDLAETKSSLAELQRKHAGMQKLEQEISNLMRDLRISEERYKLLEQRFNNLQKSDYQNSSETENIRKQLVAERQRHEQTEEQLRQSRKDFSELQRRQFELANGKKRAEKQIAELEKQLQRMQTLLEQKNEVAQTPAAPSPVKPSAESAKLQKELETLGNSFRASEERVRQLELENSKLQTRIEKSKADAEELKNSLESERRKVVEQTGDLQNLTKKNAELKQRLSARESEYFTASNTAKNINQKLEQELLALQQELVTARAAAEKRQADLKAAQDQLTAVSKELMLQKAKLETLDKSRQNSEALALAELKQKHLKLQLDFNALAAENKENRAALEAAKPKNAELEQVKLRLLELERLKQNLAKEQRLNAELAAQYRQQQSELTALRQRTAQFDRMQRDSAELKRLREELKRLEKLEERMKILASREQELTDLKLRFNQLQSQLNETGAELKNYEQKMAELRRLEQEAVKTAAVVKKLQKDKAELKSVIEAQSLELSELNAKVKGDANDRTQEQERLKKVAGKIGQLNDTINSLQEQLQTQRDNFNKQIRLLTDLQEKTASQLQLKLVEIGRLETLNRELRAEKNQSAVSLQQEINAAKMKKLQDEIADLNKLNAGIAAERDQLLVKVEQLEHGIQGNPAVTPEMSPEEYAAAGLLAEKGLNLELALWNYRQALNAKPDFAEAHLRCGRLLYARSDWKGALPHLSSARVKTPDDLQLSLETAKCQIELNRFGAAKAIIEPLQKKYPNNGMILLYSGLIAAGTGADAEGEQLIRSALPLMKERNEALLALTKLLLRSVSDRRAEAMEYYEQARRCGVEPDPEIEHTLGSMLDNRRQFISFMSEAAREAELAGDWPAAIWYYRKLLERKIGEYAPLLAFAYWKSGNNAAAVETLEFHTPDRLSMLVTALMAIGDKNEGKALAAIRKASGVTLPDHNVGIRAELARISRKKDQTPAEKALLVAVRYRQE